MFKSGDRVRIHFPRDAYFHNRTGIVAGEHMGNYIKLCLDGAGVIVVHTDLITPVKGNTPLQDEVIKYCDAELRR